MGLDKATKSVRLAPTAFGLIFFPKKADEDQQIIRKAPKSDPKRQNPLEESWSESLQCKGIRPITAQEKGHGHIPYVEQGKVSFPLRPPIDLSLSIF
jgi:hypothetical protein